MTGGAERILANKYRLITMLGQGGMGSVWRGEHLALQSPVAIKLIDPLLMADPEACSRFMREAQSAASLRSAHVVQILDYGVDGETPYIVMELLEGESLASRLRRVQRLSPAETARIIGDVCRAVARAHQAGIVHRDLKPDNIYLVPDDENEVAKVLDFGIAKSAMPGMAPGSGTRTGAMLGTPYYMSPEQASGSKRVDWRTDLWALGIIAFECITGSRPFEEETLGGLVLAICTEELPRPSAVAQVPPGFDEWFARAVNRNQEHRFQSAKELAQTLSALCGAFDVGPSLSGGVGANTRSQLDATGRVHPLVTTTIAGAMSHTGVPILPPRNRHTPWVLAGLFGVALLGGGGFFASRNFGSIAPAAGSLDGPLVTTGPSVTTPNVSTLAPAPVANPVLPTSTPLPLPNSEAAPGPSAAALRPLQTGQPASASAPRVNSNHPNPKRVDSNAAKTHRADSSNTTAQPHAAPPSINPQPSGPNSPNTNADPLGF
jgi:serine/threonine-protein kinase